MISISREISQAIWGLKGFAIILIFFAHMPVNQNNDIFLMDEIFHLLGQSGVPIFLFISGYFYKKNFSYIHKCKTLLLPLAIWGFIVYMSLFLIDYIKFGSPFILIDFIKWLLGMGSYTYFIWILFANMILCRYCPNMIIFILSIISVLLTQLNIIEYNEYFTKYLNPLNFSIYFIIGIIFRQKNYLESSILFKRKKYLTLIYSSLYIILIVFSIYLHNNFTYFNILSATINLVALIVISCIIKVFNIISLIKLGHYSFIIYLIHMPIANKINSIIHNFNLGCFEFIKIIIAVIICYIAILCIDKLLIKFKLYNFRLWLGFR